jgi:protein-S-isoprenylcysteine O-methyltransferase Ste14
VAENDDVPRILAPGPVLTALCAGLAWVAQLVRPAALFPDALAIRVCLAVLLFACFLTLGFAATHDLRRHNTSANPHHPTAHLVTSGIYGRTRNPIYTGSVAFVLAFAPAVNSLWYLLAAALLLALLHFGVVKPEEQYLTRRFGAAFDSYRKHVRRWL